MFITAELCRTYYQEASLLHRPFLAKTRALARSKAKCVTPGLVLHSAARGAHLAMAASGDGGDAGSAAQRIGIRATFDIAQGALLVSLVRVLETAPAPPALARAAARRRLCSFGDAHTDCVSFPARIPVCNEYH